MSELVKQLRAFDDKAKEVGLDARLLRDAADRIKELEAALRVNVTDKMVERAWAAIVGFDIAGQCFTANITRADLQIGISAALAPEQDK